MGSLQVTKDFQTFVDGVFIENYQEAYDLYQVASNNTESQCTFDIEPCAGKGDDTLIIHKPTNNALRLSPKALAYFPEWIQERLMNGFDAESYWGMEHAKEKDEWEERKHKDN